LGAAGPPAGGPAAPNPPYPLNGFAPGGAWSL